MDFILHKHNRPVHEVPLPEGMREILMDISREVLRSQPKNILLFVADYLDAMLVVRENTFIAKHTLDDLIQFTIDMSELMMACGMSLEQAKAAANYLRDELKTYTEERCQTEFSERLIILKLINEFNLPRDKACKVKEIIQVAFKEYFYRYIAYKDTKPGLYGSTWKEAVENTLEVYRQSCPKQSDMDRAAILIQSCYRGYFQRKNEAEKQKMDHAALLIQKTFRGHEVRKQMSEEAESDFPVPVGRSPGMMQMIN